MLGQVVQNVDNTIHLINYYPLDSDFSGGQWFSVDMVFSTRVHFYVVPKIFDMCFIVVFGIF